jgi:hypothetical protein
MNREEFDQLLDEHRRLVAAANEFEFELYRLSEAGEHPQIAACQSAAGALLGQLRNLLFRHDQEVLPLVEASLRASEPVA